MTIGEFGEAAAVPERGEQVVSSPLYWLYEMSHAALNPARAFADVAKFYFRNPANPLSYTAYGKSMAAGCELYERMTRRYAKPEWQIESTAVDGVDVPVTIETVWEQPFCRLLHFARAFKQPLKQRQPKLLIVAPMSGHFATLLRGTVETFLPDHDVYVTDWADARMVPVADGPFDLDDYIDYVMDIFRFWQRHPCRRRLPAVRAGARRHRADGSAQGPFVPRSAMPDGRADRHPPQSDRGQRCCQGTWHRLVPHPTSSPKCRFPIPA